uniref:Uncharacterized protein n=1 Tax=Knipowitschia caucasica TaxID=637954 RepID=A0AAV2MBG7_KNICA
MSSSTKRDTPTDCLSNCMSNLVSLSASCGCCHHGPWCHVCSHSPRFFGQIYATNQQNLSGVSMAALIAGGLCPMDTQQEVWSVPATSATAAKGGWCF